MFFFLTQNRLLIAVIFFIYFFTYSVLGLIKEGLYYGLHSLVNNYLSKLIKK